ncbi:MAG: LCP family protein [Treponema sp.]|jgi:anionic cell wall polymer biosynthesis LytR-Cps2A-Psr (LCP) family protein|nr:LCP family protein [Treponema sp.]
MKKGFDFKADPSILLLLVILLLLGGGIVFSLNVLHSDPVEEAMAGEEAISLLFILEGDEKPLGSYVLMYSPRNNRAAAISVPGDVGLILKTADRVDRIDSVYDRKNIGAYRTEIEGLLDLTINYTVVFEKERLARIVDVIEGVEIFIPSAVEIYGEENILFPYGNTRLDGDKAVQYIKYEIPEEDPGEAVIRRQRFFQGFLKALGEKNHLFKDPSVVRYFYPLLKSDMNRPARRRIFEALAALDVDRLGIQGVAGNYRESSGQRLLFPYYDGTVIKDVVRQAQRSLVQKTQGTLVERVFTVEILNGTTTTGLASRTAELIRGFRYEVIAADNAGRNDHEKTEIIDRTGLEDAANVFAEIIRCKNIRFESRIPGEDSAGLDIQNVKYRADFTLIIGKDFNGRVVAGN